MESVNNKYASLGRFVLAKTLGSGYNSKVKLGYDPAVNQYFAVKLIKHSHPTLNLKTLKKEIEVLAELQHPNIVNLVEFHEEADYHKKNGQTYKVVAIVMELVPGGEVFEYVADSGKFSEETARVYFHLLIETLEYCHNKGICHRDLKPENLLLDANFNLKVADFGFATLIAGKDNSGQLHTVLGTEAYMAPEIHARKAYSGPAVDLFAAGIILFILISGTPPFAKADPKSDPHYKLFQAGRIDIFWKAHERHKPIPTGRETFYSDDFRDLLSHMLAVDPSHRYTLEQIKEHPWYNGPLADIAELQQEFLQRKSLVDAELKRQRDAKLKERLMAKMQTNQTQPAPNAFTGVKPFRSLETEMESTIQKEINDNNIDFTKERKMQDYQENAGYRAFTEVFTVMSTDFIFKLLCAIGKKEFKDSLDVSESAYKIKGKAVKDQGSCTLNVVLTKVDNGTTCIEFHKRSGDVMTFYKVVEAFKNQLPVVEVEGEKTESQ